MKQFKKYHSRVWAMLLVFVMLIGIMPMNAFALGTGNTKAGNEQAASNEIYEVTVKVAPKEAEVMFYSDSNAETELTEGVKDDGVVDGYHQYTLTVAEGTYSYRATEGNQKLGGMEFKVPIADEYASDGSLMGKGQVLTLKRVNFVTTSGHITKPEDYTLHLYPQDLAEAVNGTNYINENGNIVAPVMVNAAGNATTYQCLIDINGELAKTYAVAPLENITFSPGTTVETRSFSVESASIYTITAPVEAKTQMFMQKNNYNVVELSAINVEKLADGTKKTSYAIAWGQMFTYRVSMAGKITRAGYASANEKNIVISFGENENPKSTKTTAKRIENSSLLNINTQNNLKLAVGETFRLRSFRAGWQIINSDPGNIMIEPDFNYNIVSGAEHIKMTPVTDKTTGNAGSGMNSNWMDIQAVSEGTVVIEVSYDAIQIGGDTVYTGVYGAVDESRKSVVVINIDASKSENTLEITPVNGTYNKYVWDADFDTVYFLDETADFNFTAKMENSTPDKVELSTNLGKSYTTVNKTGSTYNAEGLIHGNNILRVTKGNKVEYQIVRASRLKVSVVNMTRNSDALIVGDEIRVVFSGIYTPVPKMSGIYNPGWTSAHKTIYNVPEGVTASSSSTQYGFAADNRYTLTFTEAGTYTFTGGYITSAVMGDQPGEHRLLTDAGRGVNMNARDGSSNRCIMPDLTFEVMDMPVIDVNLESDPVGAQIEVKSETGTVIQPENDGTYQLEYGTYFYEATMDGYVPENGKFTVGGDDYLTGKKAVTISMRKIEGAIWDGKSKSKPKTVKGVYQIGTGAELYWYKNLGQGKDAILTDDISLGGFGITIEYLSGTFDGNGHYIMDFYGDSLFKTPDPGAVIKNLGVSGKVTGQGGIVTAGFTQITFTVQNCVSRVNVNGGANSGGIVGSAVKANTELGAKVIDCYNAGKVSGSGFTAGIVGYGNSQPTIYIKNCYNIGKVDNYGIATPGRGTNSNNYTLLGAAPNAGGTEVGSDVLKTYAEYLGDAYLDNPTSYNDGYPILKWEEPRALAVAQKEYPVELENYKATDEFDEVAEAARTKAVEAGKKAIADAASLAEAQEALNKAKETIDAIAEGDIPEADVDALATAKISAKAELEAFVSGGNYTSEQQKKVDAALEGGNKAIDNAKTVEEVTAALENAKKAIALIKTESESAETKPVDIYLSVSHDADYFKTKETDDIIAFKKLSVPYFDLKEYGLEQYYFVSESYEKDENYDETGQPNSNLEAGNAQNAYGKVTMLHAFIYATEIYYCGIDQEDAGKGYLKEAGLIGTKAFRPEGSAGSMYIRQLWGMDENFNYYLNYQYPLASPGWGATADQILLEDGDIITVGHFSNWSFHTDSASVFNFIKAGSDTVTTNIDQGKELELSIYRAGAGGEYTTEHTLLSNEPAVYYVSIDEVYSGNVSSWNYLGSADKNGKITVDTSYMEPGEYFICVRGQYGVELPNAIVSTPGGIILTVNESEQEEVGMPGDINGDKEVDIFDLVKLQNYLSDNNVEINIKNADVNSDNEVDIFDLVKLQNQLSEG